jgi:hypothetical protein
MKRRTSTAIAAVLACLALPTAAGAVRIMTYNLLNYSSGRESLYRKILDATNPDLLVVQEILSQGAVNNFASLVLNQVDPGEWAAAPFNDGPDTDNALFYRTSRFDFLAHFIVTTALREIDEWTLRPDAYSSSQANVRIYSLHLKASQGFDNEQQRLGEVADLRARMETFPAGQSYVVAGDFNIYTATEPAYQFMIDVLNGAAGVVQDPIAQEGNWHDNPAFAGIHTQSTRTASFGGGATGGSDDRFDLMLVGPEVLDDEGFDILETTYLAFGQDGLHFNGAINQPPYVVVDSTMAQALHDASDHFPVLADFELPAILLAPASLDFGRVIVGGVSFANLAVANGASAPADELDYELDAPPGFTAPSGIFEAQAGAANLHAISLDTETIGSRAGDLVVTTDAPDAPAHLVALSGTVIEHATPSVEAASVVVTATIDLGAVAPGETATEIVQAHNVGFGPLQALLDVDAFELSGDAGYSLPNGFVPMEIGATPGSLSVAFDATGATEGLHEGALTLHTSDEDLPGAASLGDLVYNLRTTVSNAVGVAATFERPSREGILGVAPNPFESSCSFDLGVLGEGGVRFAIYDVRGSVVATLADKEFGPGLHRLAWNGRGNEGSVLGPGIYFARFTSGSFAETRKIVRLR